jgi:hypothetical protein
LYSRGREHRKTDLKRKEEREGGREGGRVVHVPFGMTFLDGWSRRKGSKP